MAVFGTVRNAPGVGEDSTRKRKKRRSRITDPQSTSGRNARQQNAGGSYPGQGGPRDANPQSQQVDAMRSGGNTGQTGGTLAAPIDPGSNPTVRPRSDLGKAFRGDYGETLFANPQLLGQEWMSQGGIEPQQSGGMSAIYDQLSQLLPSLFYLTQGASMDPNNINMGRFADYADSFLNTMSAPGGGSLSSDVLGNLFSSMEDSRGIPTGLGSILNDAGAAPTTQAQRLLGIASAGLSGLAPGAASGYTNYLQTLADEWLRSVGKASKPGGAGSFVDFLDQRGVDDLFR